MNLKDRSSKVALEAFLVFLKCVNDTLKADFYVPASLN